MAIAVEAAWGYPRALFRRFGHPVTWIGGLIAELDARWNRATDPPHVRKRFGFAALGCLLLVSGGVALAVQVVADIVLPDWLAVLVLGALASSCLAQRSLHDHVRDVADALENDGVEAGRQAVAMIVGRDTAGMDAAAVSRAAIESLAENFADGVVAPAFWLALGGLPWGVLYKAVNTADSMIGHRTPRHEAFGFAAAKLDDAVNWPAARNSALAIVLAAALTPRASASGAWRIMRRDARGHPSPNAGWPEAAMAGALGIRLGGPRTYGGRRVDDRGMGDGTAEVDHQTIRQALRIYRTACAIDALVLVAAALAAGA